MRDILDKVDESGDQLTAEAFNTNLADELQQIPESADFTLDPEAGPDTDTSMLVKSLVIYSASSNYYDDTGAANAFVLVRSGNLQPWPEYKDGMSVTFQAANPNTGACTINIDSLGIKDLTDKDGSALSSGDILANDYVSARYDAGNDRFEVTTAIGTGLSPSQFLRSDVADQADGDITFVGGKPILDNLVYLSAIDNVANTRDVLGIDGSNVFGVGNVNHATDIISDGTLTHNSVDLITDLLPAQATHAGEFLTTDGAGVLSWAAGFSLSSWEENTNDFRPVTTKTGALGDSTHLIEDLFIMDSGVAYFGDDQDLMIYHDGADSYLTDNTGDINLNPTGVLNYNSNEVLTTASTIDADTLGTLTASQFLRSDAADQVDGDLTFVGGQPVLDNLVYLAVTDTAANVRDVIGMDGSDIFNIGNVNHVSNLISSGSLTHNSVDLITSLLPAQATHSGEFLTTDGAGTLSWAAAGGSSLTSWEENSDDLRPITTKTGALGDSTHLIEGLFIMDNGPIYVGDSQDLELLHDATDSYLINNTGDLYIENLDAASLFLTTNTPPNGWYIDSSGNFIPDTTGAYTLGTTSLRVNKGWFDDLEITNTPTIGGADFITTVLPAQATHAGEFLTTDGAGVLSWAASSGLSSWEENSTTLRPTTSGYDLGDTTHLVGDAYFQDSGRSYYGDSQDFSVYFDGTYGTIIASADLRIESSNILRLRTANNDRWLINSSGHLFPGTAGTYNLGSSTAEINNIYQADGGLHYFGSTQDMSIQHDGSDGYIANSTGQVFINGEVLGTGLKCVSFYYEGTAQDEDYIVIDSTSSEGFVFDEDVTITDITIHARVAPTGADLIVYPVKNETEISASSATLTAASYIEKTDISDISMTGDSDRLGLIIKQIGSTEPGQGITVVVHYSNT